VENGELRTAIIPVEAHYVHEPGGELLPGPFPFTGYDLDLPAICLFAATGFFWGTQTYYRQVKSLEPASVYSISQGRVKGGTKWWDWHHAPAIFRLDQAVEALGELLEQACRTPGPRPWLLGLSGGLDSRCLAAACLRSGERPNTYSYQFAGGYPENDLGRQISQVLGSNHSALSIEAEQLVSRVAEMAEITRCQADFIHPRQALVMDQLRPLGGQFLLGHWGDVLFDSAFPSGSFAAYFRRAVLKRGGAALAQRLWQHWALPGSFEEFLTDCLADQLARYARLPVPSRYRALKSTLWAPRWTSANLAYFSAAMPISLPFYSAQLCDLVCRIDEPLLADRQVQIAYIKACSPELAKITWQAKRPYNLYSHRRFGGPLHWPFRLLHSLQHRLRPVVQRNWELQFQGSAHSVLRSALLAPSLTEWLGSEIPNWALTGFQARPLEHAHPLAMLQVLAEFARRRWSRP
jgi:hypothetical protein